MAMARLHQPSRSGARWLLAVAVAITLFVLVAWLRPPVQAEADFLVFGSLARLDLRAPSREQADAALSDAGQLLAYDHRAWHAWEPSALTDLNRDLAAGRPHRVSADIAAMIRQAQRGYRLSDGLFNPAAGKLIAAWGFHTSDYPVRTAAPVPSRVEPLLRDRPSMNDVQVAADGTVSSANRAVSLDLNGLAEGFAAAQVSQLLARHGIDEGLIYIGGFVLALGRGEQTWTVGMRGPDGVLGTVALRNGEAIASSGDYQRHRAGSQTQGHILDPRAGRPQQTTAAVSVISDDPVLADIAATALMVAGPEGMDAMATKMQLACVMLLAHDGTLHITPALKTRLHLTGALTIPIQEHPIKGGDCRQSTDRSPRQDVPLPTQFRHVDITAS